MVLLNLKQDALIFKDGTFGRYVQRFDPGFGFSAGPYTVQPLYSLALNYNTEFPQLGSTPRPQIPADPPRPLPQHLPGPWVSPSNPAGLNYGHPETMMATYSPNHVNPRSASAIYLHTTQYPPCQRPGMPFIHPHEHIHQTYQQVCNYSLHSLEFNVGSGSQAKK